MKDIESLIRDAAELMTRDGYDSGCAAVRSLDVVLREGDPRDRRRARALLRLGARRARFYRHDREKVDLALLGDDDSPDLEGGWLLLERACVSGYLGAREEVASLALEAFALRDPWVMRVAIEIMVLPTIGIRFPSWEGLGAASTAYLDLLRTRLYPDLWPYVQSLPATIMELAINFHEGSGLNVVRAALAVLAGLGYDWRIVLFETVSQGRYRNKASLPQERSMFFFWRRLTRLIGADQVSQIVFELKCDLGGMDKEHCREYVRLSIGAGDRATDCALPSFPSLADELLIHTLIGTHLDGLGAIEAAFEIFPLIRLADRVSSGRAPLVALREELDSGWLGIYVRSYFATHAVAGALPFLEQAWKQYPFREDRSWVAQAVANLQSPAAADALVDFLREYGDLHPTDEVPRDLRALHPALGSMLPKVAADAMLRAGRSERQASIALLFRSLCFQSSSEASFRAALVGARMPSSPDNSLARAAANGLARMEMSKSERQSFVAWLVAETPDETLSETGSIFDELVRWAGKELPAWVKTSLDSRGDPGTVQAMVEVWRDLDRSRGMESDVDFIRRGRIVRALARQASVEAVGALARLLASETRLAEQELLLAECRRIEATAAIAGLRLVVRHDPGLVPCLLTVILTLTGDGAGSVLIEALEAISPDSMPTWCRDVEARLSADARDTVVSLLWEALDLCQEGSTREKIALMLIGLPGSFAGRGSSSAALKCGAGIPDRLQAVLEAEESMADARELSLPDACEQVAALVGAERVTLYVIESDSLVSRYASGLPVPVKLPLRLNAFSVAGYVAHECKAVNLGNAYDVSELRAIDANLRFCHMVDERTGFKTCQLLTLPVGEDGHRGVLQFINHESGRRFPPFAELAAERLGRLLWQVCLEPPG